MSQQQGMEMKDATGAAATTLSGPFRNHPPDPSSSSSSSWQAPPFPATDPTYIYPLCRFPPDSFWQQQVTVPALIVPARRTSELRHPLRHVLRTPGASKSKHHSPVQLLTEVDDVYMQHQQQSNDVNATTTIALMTNQERSQYRKLVLRSIPRPSTETFPSNYNVDEDAVYDDPAIQALLLEHDASSTTASPLRCYKARHVVTRTYPHDYGVDEILRVLLPTATELPGSSFEVVGTIAHVNLRDEFIPFQYWIGKVLYDKHQPRIQTTVTKVGTIETVFRTFEMQVIAPCCDEEVEVMVVDKKTDNDNNDNNTATTTKTTTTITRTVPRPQKDWNIVTVNEEGCTFQLDYQKVYWNSRLSGEHQRLVKWLLLENRTQQQQNGGKALVVADLMAGVGPFAIPLSTTNKTNHHHRATSSNNKTSSKVQPIFVHANDLNPSCYQYLNINARNNKCPSQQLKTYNMDGRRLVHTLQDEHVRVDHFIMNLPAMAPECCSAFQGYQLQPPASSMPKVHVYCFAPKPTTPVETNTNTTEAPSTTKTNDDAQQPPHPYQSAVDRCSRALQCELEWQRDDISVHVVRDVSPNKNMVCVSFRLPLSIQDLPRVDLKEEHDDDNVPVGEEHGSHHQSKIPPSADSSSVSPDAKRPKLMP